ncbi:MAG: hypothetical protein ACLFVJ_02340 [Persicimonas sp.]
MMIRRLAVALLVVSLGAAGCGDDNASNNANNDPLTPTADAGDDGSDADTPDADDEDGGEPADAGDTDPGEDAGDAGAVEDADPDPQDAGDDAVSGPTCEDGDDADCDYDGLLDCEEEQIGTDPCNPDTDGDGLNDMQELLEGSDPQTVDTDGDGVEDGKEVDLGLDPTKESSFNDGIPDGDRWVVTACDDPSAEQINFRSQDDANWRVALPPAFNANYAELTIAGATRANRRAASMYDDPTNEVAGYLVSTQPTSSQRKPNDVLDSYHGHVTSLGSIEQDAIGGEFITHDYQRAAIGRYLIETSSDQTVKEVRESLFRAMTPYEADVSGYPSTSGATYKDFRIFVSVIYREDDSGDEQVLTSVAIAPADKYDNRDRVQFRMDDLTNTTNIAPASSGDLLRCDLFEPKENTKADFYWVLDQSGSMNDDFQRMLAVANEFYNELTNTGLDYRLGVTHMTKANEGKLRSVGWHTDLNTFTGEVDYITDCPSSVCDGGLEYGIFSAYRGIEFMKGITGSAPNNQKIRPDAELITIFMSDEEDQDFQNNSLTGATGQQMLNNYVNFFTQHSISFAIVGDGSGCGVHDGEAYKLVSQATGGGHASLCATDISETIEDIIFATSGSTGYELPDTPISSSLRVYVNGQWVPRSRENGFDYFAQSNAIAFFGDYQPELPENEGDAPDFLAISYETFVDRSKEEAQAGSD